MGVDRVVAQGPGDAADVEQPCRPADTALDRGPAQKSAVVKCKSQKGLRPIGDALHQGVEHHQQEGAHPQQNREQVELQQDGESRAQQHCHEGDGSLQPDGTGRQRAPAGALDLGVEVAVEDVVKGAAGGTHHERAGGKEHHQLQARQPIRGESDRPEAGPEQEPHAHRMVQPGQRDKGACERRHRALNRPRPSGPAPGGRRGHVVQALDHGRWCIVAPRQ